VRPEESSPLDPSGAAAPSEPSGAIEITARFFPLAVVLHLCKPRFVVDSREEQGRWRTPKTFSVAPGSHHVRVYYNYMGFDGGIAEGDVEVGSGDVKHITYEAPATAVFGGRNTRDRGHVKVT